MAGVDDQIKQAVEALKAGRKAEARTLLENIVEQNQRHEQAWFYLSAAVDSLEEQEICLENVLAINPHHAKARQGLESLRQKKQSLSGGSPPSTPHMSPATPRGSGRTGPPIGAEYDPFSGGFDAVEPSAGDDQAFDWFAGTPSSAALDSGPDTDPYAAIPTSVEWGRSDEPDVQDSGQEIDAPSAQEWDAWVQGLSIVPGGVEAPPPSDQLGSQSPFLLDDEDPFGETPYSVDDDDISRAQEVQPSPGIDDAFGDEPFGEPSSWFSSFDDDEAFETEGAPDDEPFTTFNNFDTPAPVRSFAGNRLSSEMIEPVEDDLSFDADAVESAHEDQDFDFSFDEDDDDFDEPDLAARLFQTTAAPASALAAPQSGSDYYRLIPGEIEAKAGGVEPRGLMMLAGIVILLVLNLISFGALLL